MITVNSTLNIDTIISNYIKLITEKEKKKMNSMLACALGVSTGMLVQKMKDYAKEQGKYYKIWAVDQNSIKEQLGNFDVLLLGPQVSYLYDNLNKEFGDEYPVAIIEPIHYGRLIDDKVVEFTEELIEEKNTKESS